MLASQIIGESLDSRRDDYIDFAYHDYMDAMIENGYSTDTYYSGLGYVEQYARSRCTEIVDTAILHKADSYYFSTDHTIAIGEDESNAVANYHRELLAIAQGYTKKTWTCNLDGKEREHHRTANGQTVGIFEPFIVGSSKLMFPLDRSLDASLREICNCRCVAVYSGRKRENDLESIEQLVPIVAIEQNIDLLENKAYDDYITTHGTYGLDEADFKTDKNKALFWSNVGGYENAMKYAQDHELITLEMVLEEKGIEMPDWDIENPQSTGKWNVASAMFAKGAQGLNKAIVRTPLRPNNTFNTIEEVILDDNKQNDGIIIYDYDTQKVIKERKKNESNRR